MKRIPFNRPYVGETELDYLRTVLDSRRLSGNLTFTTKCHRLLESICKSPAAFLCHSGTGALEMAALLADIRPGEEVLMPSFTFVSTANAVVLRGGVPVFVDIRGDTLNIDENLLDQAITNRTRAIMPVHYAGVPCDMDSITAFARQNELCVLSDAAQAIGSVYHSRPAGQLGDCAAISFHETKNLTCGEGGALIVNRMDWIERAEILWEKGTNRAKFFRGEIDKYTWVDIGSSFLASELIASVLLAQLERLEWITERRRGIWRSYYEKLTALEVSGYIRLPTIPEGIIHNGHLFYILVETPEVQMRLLNHLKQAGISAVFHYVPLHSAPGGKRWGRIGTDLSQTEDISSRLVRLPLWAEMDPSIVDNVTDTIHQFFGHGNNDGLR